MGGSSHGVFDAVFPPPMNTYHRHSSTQAGPFEGGLFGAALGLMDGISSMHQRGIPAPSRRATRAASFGDTIEGQHSDDDDLAYGTLHDGSGGRPRSVFSRIKDRLLEGKPPSTKAASAAKSPCRDGLPSDREQRPHLSSMRAASIRAGKNSDDAFDRSFEQPRQRPQPSRPNSANANMVEALENAIRYHADEVRRCKKQLERASRQSKIHSGHLQGVLNELKLHESSLAAAVQSLETAKANRSRPTPLQQAPRNTRSTRPRSSVQSGTAFDDTLLSTGIPTFATQRGAMHLPFAGFDDVMDPFGQSMFDQLHRQFFSTPSMLDGDVHSFFGMPSDGFPGAQRKRPRFSTRESGQDFEQNVGLFADFTQMPPRPPPTLLTPEEATRLFEQYNDQWLALPPTDSRIPYPTRGLHAPALMARDTLWAPMVSAHPATWSEETVMQANAQAFFLIVVGLAPRYTEAATSGRVEMGYDAARATTAQTQQLVAILKKEKMRWHSDKLGRRNDGQMGPNQVLQNDARARAVFHAVCALMETATG
ncbi:hypothetical protein B0A50_05257 [Salinomyces thailandicus]|uniref:Uncharacterized protein n=1 Tax=Salinomyces thailandicus TaxID=706561 RepID=A0A4U0TYE3_9PEZI|nr:hypothetical protein B0A50_05257 [Salinomyces thailandica]